MSLTINTNIPSLATDKSIDKATKRVQDNFEKLASGRRINRASDDPAGLAIALDMLASADTSVVAARNISDGVSAANIADGSIETATSITTRLNELSAQSANGTLSDSQRVALNQEFQELRSELDRISQSTEFNGQQLLNGSYSLTIQAGTTGGSGSQIPINLPGVSSASLGITADISTQAGARAALDQTRAAVETLSASRGEIGAGVSRLEKAFENVKTSELNLRDAASRIMDVDFAKASTDLMASRIQQQAALAVKAQANALPSLALKLLG